MWTYFQYPSLHTLPKYKWISLRFLLIMNTRSGLFISPSKAMMNMLALVFLNIFRPIFLVYMLVLSLYSLNSLLCSSLDVLAVCYPNVLFSGYYVFFGNFFVTYVFIVLYNLVYLTHVFTVVSSLHGFHLSINSFSVLILFVAVVLMFLTIVFGFLCNYFSFSMSSIEHFSAFFILV